MPLVDSVKKLCREHSCRIPLLFQRLQFLQFPYTTEAKLNWTGARSVLKVCIFRDVRSPHDVDHVIIELIDFLAAPRVGMPDKVVPL